MRKGELYRAGSVYEEGGLYIGRLIHVGPGYMKDRAVYGGECWMWAWEGWMRARSGESRPAARCPDHVHTVSTHSMHRARVSMISFALYNDRCWYLTAVALPQSHYNTD